MHSLAKLRARHSSSATAATTHFTHNFALSASSRDLDSIGIATQNVHISKKKKKKENPYGC